MIGLIVGGCTVIYIAIAVSTARYWYDTFACDGPWKSLAIGLVWYIFLPMLFVGWLGDHIQDAVEGPLTRMLKKTVFRGLDD